MDGGSTDLRMPDAAPSDRQGMLNRLWFRLTEPGPGIVDYERRIQSRFLAITLVVLAPAGVLLVVAMNLLSIEAMFSNVAMWVLAIVSIGLGGVAWGLSRTAQYRVAAYLVVIGTTAAIYLSALISGEPLETHGYYFFILPAIITKFLLGRRVMVATMLVHLALILLTWFIQPSIEAASKLIEPFAFYLLTSVLLVIIDAFRERLEQDRRNLVEAANQKLQSEVLVRKRADARLFYQANLLENVSDAIVAVDMKFIVQSWNRAAEILYGWSTQEAVGQSLLSLSLSGYDAEQGQSVLSGLLRSRSWRGELNQRNRLGDQLQVQVSSNLVRDEAGVVTGLVMLNHDITDSKKSTLEEARQRRLAQALQETAALLNSSLNLNIVLDRLLIQVERVLPYDTASIMLIEEGMATISHHRGFEQRGFSASDLNVFRLKVEEKESLRWMYEQRRPILIADSSKAVWWSQDPTALWIKSYLGSPIQLDDEVIGFINLDKAVVDGFTWEQADLLKSFADQAAVAIRNARLYRLTERYAKDQEQQVIARTMDLERERGQLRAILDSMSEGVLCLMFGEPPMQIVNPALLRMTGLTEQELDWDSLRAASVDERTHQEILDEIISIVAHKGMHHVLGAIRRGTEGEFDAEINCSSIQDREGRLLGLLMVFRDVSEEKALAEQKSRFVANASHELRTPLTNLMTRLYIFRRTPERYEEHLGILEDVAERMRRLVDDLLDYSRFERGMIPLDRQDMDLRPVLKAVTDGQIQEADHKSIQIQAVLPDTPLAVHADSSRIAQVFTNLLTNAINYTPEGGHITLRAYLTEAPEVVIEVEDTGVGIPPAALADIFKPFVRAHENTRGTGLGLSITHDIIRLHEGTITVSSEVNKGSVFKVQLPYRKSWQESANGGRSG